MIVRTLSDTQRATLLSWAVAATLLGAAWLGLDAARSESGLPRLTAPARLEAARHRLITTRTRAS